MDNQKYRSKNQLIHLIKERGKIFDDTMDDWIKKYATITIFLDINDLINKFGKDMPEEFYTILWDILRDSAISIFINEYDKRE